MFTVLHIEHNRFYHAIVKNVLSKDQISYISVKSPAEALEILKNTKVNLIITGLIFENINGEEFIKELSSGKYKNIPIMVMSSNDEQETIKRLRSIGVVNYINKNESLDILKASINKYVSRNATYKELQKFKIAVLENNELELMTLRRMFESNYVSNVHYYNNPEIFIESTEKYNLYIIDYKLSKFPGEYIVSVLRERNPKAVIIATTAVDNEEIISNILNAGANDYIKKPIAEDIFLARIHINTKGYIIDNDDLPVTNKTESNDKKFKDLIDKDSIHMRLNEEIKRIRRHKGKLSIVYLGIDRYEQMKIGYGESYIYEVVKVLSETLKDHIRLTDIMGYINDKEFLILLPSTDLPGAFIIADKLRDIIQDSDFGREELTITVSGGVCELMDEDEVELISKANELMHQARFFGGNRIENVLERGSV